MPKRTIYKHTKNLSVAIRNILQSLFISEISKPSKCVWLISPWISDINIVDNRSGGFASLCPDWPNSEIKISQVIKLLLLKNTTIVIATRLDEYSRDFINKVSTIAFEEKLESLLIIKKEDNLHIKGILTDSLWLSGSMNLTFNGIYTNDEVITMDNDDVEISKAKLELCNTYGGVLDA